MKERQKSGQHVLLRNMSSDSLANSIGISSSMSKGYYILPTFVQMRYSSHVSGRLALHGALNMLSNAEYKPQVTFSPVYTLPYNISLLGSFCFGGYSNVDVGTGISKQFGQRAIAGCASWFIENAIAPAKSTGQGIQCWARFFF